jgi:hypothetical protein
MKIATLQRRDKRAEVHHDGTEYVVRFYSGSQHLADADYFTDDVTDALDTARFYVFPVAVVVGQAVAVAVLDAAGWVPA